MIFQRKNYENELARELFAEVLVQFVFPKDRSYFLGFDVFLEIMFYPILNRSSGVVPPAPKFCLLDKTGT